LWQPLGWTRRLTVIPMQFDTRPMLATLTDKPFDDPDWVF